jgi:hypothetical protein
MRIKGFVPLFCIPHKTSVMRFARSDAWQNLAFARDYFIGKRRSKSGIVVPAKAGTQSNQTTGFPLSRE